MAASLPPFDDAVPASLREAAQPCHPTAGEVLGRQGAAPRFLYFVVAGELRLARTGRDGQPVILQRVRQGWAAEASLFAARYHCDLVAGAPTEAVRVPVPALRAALETSPAFARHWIQTLSVEVRRLRGHCERLGLRGAEARIRHAIESDGTDGRLPITGTLKDWATELGLTHEALYRALARMQAQRLLRRDGATLVLESAAATQAARRAAQKA